jgi:hypothetical protein
MPVITDLSIYYLSNLIARARMALRETAHAGKYYNFNTGCPL